MTEALIPTWEYWSVFGTAILPILELKAAIPLGFGFGIPIWTPFLLAYIGSCLPCPFIIFFIERIIKRMAVSRVKLFYKFAGWLLGKVEKHKGKIEKYGYLGVFIFVAIPLPGTGVYTGSLLAAMMGLQPKKAIPVVLVGNLVAGFAMMVFSSFFWPELALWA